MPLRFESFFSTSGQDPYDKILWERRESKLTDSKGKVYHHYTDLEFPNFWSQSAIDIATSKYFRRAGVPEPYGKDGSETSLKNLILRVTKTIAQAGVEQKYFKQEDADIFEKELRTLLVEQRAAFNSPVWFNCGLYHQYGIKGTKTELYSWDERTRKVQLSEYSYEKPQISACFIQSVSADPESIEALAQKETKLFRFGSGSGTNFSNLPGSQETENEQQKLIPVLEMLDRGAALVKSGGIARRAAKMVCLDDDHPDILAFVRWKLEEERKLKALVEAGQEGHFEGEAFQTLTGQNSNNSVRISDEFLEALKHKDRWLLKSPQTRKPLEEIPAQEIWKEICQAAWECADPGVQFSDTINNWNTCARSGGIRASNPCSEYMFLDETACNLASINLAKFYSNENGFDFEAYRKAIRTLIIAQDILVDFAGYPTQAIARNCHRYRTLGLGYANLGGLFMRMGFSYASKQATDWTHVLTATLQSEALLTSSEISRYLAPFEAYPENAKSYAKVISQHKKLWSEFNTNLPTLKEVREYITTQWEQVEKRNEMSGIRNAQVSVIAPTGTIGLFMGCETTGIEPEYSLIRYKQLSGGGVMKFINSAIEESLKNLKYSPEQIVEITDYLLKNETIEGAPHLKDQHLPVFDACYSGRKGTRRIGWLDQLQVVQAAQKFISGAISKTVNLPREATPEEISELYLKAHKMGIKSVSIYREGSKSSQPLTSSNSSL